MRWVTSKEESDYMRERQKQNLARSSGAEDWMAAKLASTPYKWTRQAMHGYRLYDFWSHEMGIAVEVDGPEHRPAYDQYRDGYNFYRSAILVLRVRNFNEDDAAGALREIAISAPWPQRRKALKPGKALLTAHGYEMARSPTARKNAEKLL